MRASWVLVAAAIGAVAAPPAAAVEGAWAKGIKASVRLLADGIGADGRLAAGIEIVMPRGWHTYWRSPGGAGIAPAIDSSRSRNVGALDIAFPVPTRLDDGFAVTNVYYDRVVLPVSAVVSDPGEPVDLAVTLDLGVCAEVCVPETIGASLSVPADANDAAVGIMLAEARALVPATSQAGVFAVEGATRDGGTDTRPVFGFVAAVPDAQGADVFVEGPPDWSPYTPILGAAVDGKLAWTVEFSRLRATTPIAGASVRVTIVSDGRAIEQTVPLD